MKWTLTRRMSKTNLLRFVNDPDFKAQDRSWRESGRDNVTTRLVTLADWEYSDVPEFVTTKHIKTGEELLISYGKGYWAPFVSQRQQLGTKASRKKAVGAAAPAASSSDSDENMTLAQLASQDQKGSGAHNSSVRVSTMSHDPRGPLVLRPSTQSNFIAPHFRQYGQNGGAWYNPLTWHSDIYNYMTRDYTPAEKKARLEKMASDAEQSASDQALSARRLAAGGRMALYKQQVTSTVMSFLKAKTLSVFATMAIGALLKNNPDLMEKWLADLIQYAPELIYQAMMWNNPINRLLLAYSQIWLPAQNLSSAALLTSNLMGQGGSGMSRKRQRGYGTHAGEATYKRIKVRLCDPSASPCVTCVSVFCSR